jgi:hypothetical protein
MCVAHDVVIVAVRSACDQQDPSGGPYGSLLATSFSSFTMSAANLRMPSAIAGADRLERAKIGD